MSVRTRVAPSPTGDPHIGTAYVALVNYLFAKKNDGEFVLRIEDTDRDRSTLESEANILKSLRWLGLHWDEGPEAGGMLGPYRQSERSDIYKFYVDQLVEEGHAFPCFCTEHRLDDLRKAQKAAKMQPRYDGHCCGLPADEVKRLLDSGTPHVIRMKVPNTGKCVIHDHFRGDIEFDYHQVDMQVLVKSDGFPTYHLANVVDDHLMEITHVFRGEEWISSAPKHYLLYQYFGWDMPRIGHLPLLRNADATKTKLSKRKNPTSILWFQRAGYLPEAMVNFLALLVTKIEAGNEIFSLSDLEESFDLNGISLGGPVFDTAKLDWINGIWMREKVSTGAVAHRFRDWAFGRDGERLDTLIALAQCRAVTMGEVGELIAPFLVSIPKYLGEPFAATKMDNARVGNILIEVMKEFETLKCWQRSDIDTAFRSVAERTGIKLRDLTKPWYVAMYGTPQGLPVFDGIELLGRDTVRQRVRFCLKLLGVEIPVE